MRPPHATATGKVLLASLTEKRRRAYIAGMDLQRFTPRTVVDARRLLAELKRVGAAGMALDDGEYREDVCCVAMPVRDFSGRVVGAMGLSGPLWRMTPEVRARKLPLLGASARRLSQELGYGGLSDTFSPAVDRLADAGRSNAAPSSARARRDQDAGTHSRGSAK